MTLVSPLKQSVCSVPKEPRQRRGAFRRIGAWAGLLFFAASLAAPGAVADFGVAYGSGPAARFVASERAEPVWRYTVRPGDSLPQIAEDLLKPGRSWPDLVHFNRLPNRASAVPGSSLQIPVQWLKQQPQPARVLAVSGSAVRRSNQNNRALPLRDGDVLHVGDQVQTLDGRAAIQLADGSTLRLEPASLLIFDRMTQFGKSGMADTRLRLERGRMGTQVRPLVQSGSNFRIETPSAVAAVRGTAFRLSTEPGQTRLEVTEGQVAFGNDQAELLVGAGLGAELSSKRGLHQYPLPPAPKLSSVPASVERLPLGISWPAITGVAEYQIDVFNRENNRWLQSRNTSAPRQMLEALDNGEYSIEVAAVSPWGLTGVPAKADFSIGLQAHPALLESPSDGATLADAEKPRFSWAFQGANEKAQVEISRQSSFSNVIASSSWSSRSQGSLSRTLAPGQYYWRVVTEAGGSSVATSDTRSLLIGGQLETPDIINVNYFNNEVRIFWRNVAMADAYLMQLARDPGFDSVIKEVEIDATTAALRLATGERYFVRLRGLTDGPLESSWGPGRELYVE